MFDEDKHAIKIISLFKDLLVSHAEGRCSSGPRHLRVPIGLDDQRSRCFLQGEKGPDQADKRVLLAARDDQHLEGWGLRLQLEDCEVRRGTQPR